MESEVKNMPFPNLENFKIQKKISNRLCYSLYDAVDQRDNRHVFLKLLNKEFNDNQTTISNFLSGARIARIVNHPDIAKIYDSGEDKGHYFISSEAIEFEPLSALILEIFSLSFADLTKIFTNIAKALNYAHLRGVVHGFLNPTNVYINSNSEIKISDLGFSWYIPDILSSDTKESTNLAKYIAPEYYESVEQADGRGDIYSLGVVLYEFLTGSPPFDQNDIASIQKQHLAGKIPLVDYDQLQLPVEFNEIINKSINKFTDKRFQNSNEFIQSLETLSEKYLAIPTPLEISEQQVAAFEEKVKNFKSQRPLPGPTNATDMSTDMSIISYEQQGLRSGPKKFLNASLVILALLAVVIFGKSFFFDTSGSDDFQNGLAHSSEVTQPAQPNQNQNENLNSVASAIAALDSLNSLFIEETNLSGVEDPPKSNGSSSGEFELKPANSSNENVLKPAHATMNIFVSSNNKPIAAGIFLDDKFVGKSDNNGRLSLSELELEKVYTARVSLTGYVSATKYITLSQKTTDVTLDVKPEIDTLGTLNLDAIPGADSIFVDNILFGNKTPFEMKFQRGRHQIRLVNSSLQKSWGQTVDLKAGQLINIKHDFSNIEFGKVAISVKNAFEFGFGFVYVDGKIWHEKHNTTPLALNLEVGPHKIEVRRDGFITLPSDTTIMVTKDTKGFASFRLLKNQ